MKVAGNKTNIVAIRPGILNEKLLQRGISPIKRLSRAVGALKLGTSSYSHILHPSNDLFTIVNFGGNIIYELFFLHYSIYGRTINFGQSGICDPRDTYLWKLWVA